MGAISAACAFPTATLATLGMAEALASGAERPSESVMVWLGSTAVGVSAAVAAALWGRPLGQR